ncbi:MAG: DUF2817 domain-containing protein [Bdellovibrio sp.]|nr:MAG: DUF2817 domain-containing protein [Bdellovibrio sp.]
MPLNFYKNPNWALSREGRAIPLYASKDPHSFSNRPLLLIGGVHGNEPEGVFLAEKTLEWIESYKGSHWPVPWMLIPCLNPDGYHKKQRGNAHNVDLNRNYPSSDWTSSYSEKKYFPGPSPASEPEVQAIVTLTSLTNPCLFIHFHSWVPCIVCTGNPAKTVALELAVSSGYAVTESIGYDTPGGLSRWGWHDQRIPVICVEESEGCSKETTWSHFGAAIQKILSSSELYQTLK